MESFFTRIKQSPSDYCFLIGNGLNRYMMMDGVKKDNEDKSWLGYLQEIANQSSLHADAAVCQLIDNMIEENKKKTNQRHCITNPEISSLLEDAIREKEMGRENTLHKQACKVAKKYFQWKKKDCHFLQYLRTNNVDNIFTINYEYNIERALGMIAPGHQFPKFASEGKDKQDQFHRKTKYRLDEYSTGIDENQNNTKVWHLHGHLLYNSTILLSMTDYMSAISYIKNNLFFDKNLENHINICEKKAEDCYCGNTWLYPFFNKQLVIIGCSLGIDESFLRWLLLYRYRKRQTAKTSIHDSYYLTTEHENKEEPQDFIKSLGIKTVVFSKDGKRGDSNPEEDFNSLYNNTLWI